LQAPIFKHLYSSVDEKYGKASARTKKLIANQRGNANISNTKAPNKPTTPRTKFQNPLTKSSRFKKQTKAKPRRKKNIPSEGFLHVILCIAQLEV
jgi:hypothetical protein